MLTILERNNSNWLITGCFDHVRRQPGQLGKSERIKKLSILALFMEQAEENSKSSINPSYKSWGKEQIARFLDRNGIVYKYEYPLAVVDRGKVRVYYPDFRLPELGFIIEYFGVNGDPAYDERTRHKMEVYKQAGIEGLFLTKESFKGDWPTRIMSQIEGILKNRLDKLYNRRRAKV